MSDFGGVQKNEKYLSYNLLIIYYLISNYLFFQRA